MMDSMNERNKTGSVYRNDEQQARMDEEDLGLFIMYAHGTHVAGIAINRSLLADQGSYNDTPLTPIFNFPTTTQSETSYRMPAPWVAEFTEGLSGTDIVIPMEGRTNTMKASNSGDSMSIPTSTVLRSVLFPR